MVFGLSPSATTSFIWLIIIFVGVSITWTIKFMIKRNYPYEIVIHADMEGSGRAPIQSYDRARLITVSKDGVKILWLRRNKIARAYYGNFVGLRKLAYVVEKGNWFAVIYGGINRKLKELEIEPQDIQSQKLVGQSIKTVMDKQFPDNKASKVVMFMALGVIVVLAVSGFILYKNIKASNESTLINLEVQKLNKENIQSMASANLNFTEGLKDVIAQLYLAGGQSGVAPA